MKKELFLLGGADLEMQAIKELLIKHEKNFKDKSLSWGAKLSSYAESLEFDGEIYGIELEEDIQAPKNYHTIDHHGKYYKHDSSLEQIAALLGVELSDQQNLIAANDKEYIFGMKKLCASKEKIEEIRKKEREILGINKDDEDLAVASINQANKSNIIFSQTPHFIAISDKVYENHPNYLIYNDAKAIFYGFYLNEIQKFLISHGILENDYYYGGGDYGFVGIKEGTISKEKLHSLVVAFKKEQEKLTHSYHTFMFPFLINGKHKASPKWKYKKFDIETQREYNEFHYFYKHVQDGLYNNEEENEESFISKYYEYIDGSKGTYTIDCKKGKYELSLDGISLRLFNSNIAILSFNLKNNHYTNTEDILAINDFGRRIYPQFLGDNYTQNTKDSILAHSISLTIGKDVYTEDFSHFDKKENLKTQDRLPEFLSKLLDDIFEKSDNSKENKRAKIEKIIDDRMFTISYYNNSKLAKEMAIYDKNSDQYFYENSDFWYEYVYVDGNGKTSQSKHLTKKLLSDASYDRWVEYSTLFGISRYSFVALTSGGYGENVILPHIQTMYFQMCTLLLAYRASIIAFSNKIQDTTSLSDEEKLFQNAKKLYKDYLRFLNKLYFKEITAQEQGIELYNQASKIMDIEKHMSDLDNEINELHNYINILEEGERNKQLGFISSVGAILLPPSIISSVFGMNTLNLNPSVFTKFISIALIIFSGIIGYLWVSRKDKLFLLSLLLFALIFFFTISYF
ncbi:MAG: hypothetical protein IE887_04000 [Campylobacterales bacterium]|nr:hypothetical protein [Campylobacterales bacterium]